MEEYDFVLLVHYWNSIPGGVVNEISWEQLRCSIDHTCTGSLFVLLLSIFGEYCILSSKYRVSRYNYEGGDDEQNEVVGSSHFSFDVLRIRGD